MQLLKVEWYDHYHRGSWKHLADPVEHSDYIVTSVGFKVDETKKYLVIAMNFSNSDQYSDTMHILKNNIKSRKRLA